jgi:transcriptional regulator with XRE-family HTH domain
LATENSLDIDVAAGLAIRQLRRARGYSRKKLAEVSGLDHAYITWLERGQGPDSPELGTVVRIADALGVSLPDLFRLIERLR